MHALRAVMDVATAGSSPLMVALTTSGFGLIAVMIQANGAQRRSEFRRIVQILKCHRHDADGQCISEIVE